MAYEFKHLRRVEFADTDLAGIMHFSRVFPYMEECEHAFYRSLGFSVINRDDERPVGWPRVHASCDYKRPFRYEDVVEVQLVVRKRGETSLAYDFLMRLQGEEEVRAHGKMVVVTIAGDPARGMRAVPLPEAVRAHIEAAPPGLLED